ncbi:TetR/AcrR family transcriptional regulator [Actinoallomurus purpureus]|uniref:TetR/AcrR family transcriptional regulator n=1 Tax=Actinoallomurus purpureus TaxID=478114 RepID=UPI002092EAF8|nr:TetR/AcrR family transcriptional regulator [Actinoallomurus purpureus]MCO6008634.1 TetR/AcrR family transcriptional regulator [Actinoallomurus purpureus]
MARQSERPATTGEAPPLPAATGVESAIPGSRSAREPGRAIKPGRHGLPPETVAGIQRDRLIDAFVQVVAEHGYARTTISKITEAAGVTKKTFYVHFAEMDDCFLAAYQRGTGILLDRMTHAYEAASSWPEGMRAGLRVMLEVLAGEPRFARAALVEVNAAGPRLRKARIEHLARFRRFFADPAYDLLSLPTVVIDAIIGGIYGAVYAAVEGGEGQRLPEMLPSLVYFALLPLGREEAAAELERGDQPSR